MEIPDLLSNAVKRFPERRCVAQGDRSRTFAEVDDRANRVAAALREWGVRPGDRVALLAFNELEYLETQVGAMRAEAVLVPLNYRLAVPELAYIITDCEPSLLISGPGLEGTAEELSVERAWHLGDRGPGVSYDEVVGAVAPTPRPLGLRSDVAMSILYTSGTSGRPKGAVISNAALWARVNMFGLEVGMGPRDVFVQALPMFHIASNLAYGFTYQGASTVLMRQFDPAEAVSCLERERASHVLLVPTMINMLCNEPTLDNVDLDALRMVLYGASSIPPEVLRRAMDRLGCDFLQFYGMTETAGATLLRPPDHDPQRHPELLPSAGTDSLSMEAEVVDADDTPLPAGEVGEIVTRGPCLMDGYWNAPEQTKEALRNGWMHTGDLGYRSEAGYVFVTDRVKDMIVTGGENVYPREVEDVLYEHPDVLEAAVIGVPNEQWGEAVHAVVVPREAKVDPADVSAHCRAQLAGYKVPKSVELVDELPKNPTGKILKRVLRDSYWAAPEPDG